jgi:exonuclease SbcC
LRDRLSAAALAPPPASRDDLSADWTALTGWSGERVPEERRAVEEQRAAAETARTRFEWRIEEQRSACAAADVAAPGGNPRDACVHALAEATARKDRLDRDLESARTVRTELAVVARDANTAKDLGRHLDARNFERWLMTRALHRLIAGATQVLRELSGGAYSLALDQRNDFLVVDHRNADERRMARTLSGGETFLASLSLALALAEQVAEVTAGGAAKLEALFLDEGFGTLDADTLDIVAAAIEELGSRGRMVGIVTHVRDLAERVPVRFDVQKIGGNSRIERVVRPG